MGYWSLIWKSTENDMEINLLISHLRMKGAGFYTTVISRKIAGSGDKVKSLFR